MAAVIPDTLDFRDYMRRTEAACKVRPASAFIDDVKREFHEKAAGKRYPGMKSTKARHFLEFLPGDTTAWTGFNGHRKSMFTSQVQLDLCDQGERVLVASFEMTPARSLGRMARQAAGEAIPSDPWLDAFHAWTDDKLWIFDHLGRISPEQVIALCYYFAEDLKGNHVFIDSMMMVCESEEHLDEQKQFTTDIVRVGLETGMHMHLVTHGKKPQNGDESKPMSKYDMRGAAAISDQCPNVAVVWANMAKKLKLEENRQAGRTSEEELLAQPDALLAVRKQRNSGWEGTLKFWFDENSLRFTDSRTAPVEPYDI